MDFEQQPYIVYVQTNQDNYITAINSSAFLTDTAGWTEIDSGYGDKYHHAQGNYLDNPLYTDSGVHRYKLDGGKIRECTPEEIRQQEAAIPPQPDPPADLEGRVTTLEEDVATLKTGYAAEFAALDAAYTQGVNSV